MQIRTLLIGLAALAMAIVGAYFSIQGLTALFAGAGIAITIMAAVMEFSKLVTASFVYLYWNRITIVMKSYLITAISVLVFITSIGIYGFLTSAFQTSNQELEILDRRVEVIENRKARYNQQIESAEEERGEITASITSLNEGLSNNVVQYVDSTGQLVTTTSGATRRALREQLSDAQDRRNMLSQRIDAYTDSVTTLDEKILELQNQTEVTAELGPLQYIADVTSLPMSDVVNILALLITVTFDPLAISLVVAFNMSIYYAKRNRGDMKVIETTSESTEGEPESESRPRSDWEWPDDDEAEEAISEAHEELETTGSLVEGSTLSHPDYDSIVDLFADEPTNDSTTSEPQQTDQEAPTPSIEVENVDIPDKINFEKPQHAPIKFEGIVAGYDTTGDGTIDKWSTNSKRNQYKSRVPYYAKPGYDWKNDKRWLKDQAAVNFWITNIKNKNSQYPDDFTSKVY